MRFEPKTALVLPNSLVPNHAYWRLSAYMHAEELAHGLTNIA
jgi:hypothetical protein